MAIQQVTFNDVEDTLEVQASDATTGMVGFQITDTWMGTITFESTVNGTDWVSQLVRNAATEAVPTSATTTANGVFVMDLAGLLKGRARLSTDTSGAAKVDAIAQIG